MSLIQFLTVTRSFGAVRDEPSPFKMSEENLLPKFGPAKSVSDETVLPAEERECEETSQLNFEQKFRASERKAGVQQQKMKPVSVEQSKVRAEVSAESSPRKGWTLLTSFKGLGKLFKAFGAKARKPARKRNPLQPELGLDMVRPVRNDLNDSDLELIPAPKPVAESAPALKLAEAEQAAHVEPRESGRKVTRRASAQRNVFSPPEENAAAPSGTPELACAGKSDLVGAWWGRLRTGLSKIKSREP